MATNYLNDLFSSSGSLTAFPINGVSMSPVIHNGDIVICRKITKNEFLAKATTENNFLAAIKLNNGDIWVKYCKLVKQVYPNEAEKIKLSSADYLSFDPFFVNLNDISHFFKVVRRISKV